MSVLQSFRQNVSMFVFRFSKANMLKLVEIFGAELQGRAKEDGETTDGRRGKFPLDPLQQLCVLMSFYSGGGYQRPAGHLFGFSRSASGKIIRRVAGVIAEQTVEQVVEVPKP